MFLTATNIVHYLLARGLVAPEDVVAGRFVVAEAGRRNRNYRVTVEGGRSLFVKQVGSAQPDAIATLQREAACYRLAHADPSFRDVAALMPELVAYDPARHVLSLAYIEGENVLERHLRLGAFPAEIGALLGRGLGTYHGEAGQRLAERAGPLFAGRPPWILTVYDAQTGFSGGNAQLVEVLRRYPEFQTLLRALHDDWAPNALIHGDMKWDNCIIGEVDGAPALRIVDWEVADVGDPAWDVGAVFQHYLAFWIGSMPSAAAVDPEAFVSGAAVRIDDMHPAIGAFWRAYVETRGLIAVPGLLRRSVRSAAARMVQSAFEQLYTADRLHNTAVALLQVSLNMLRDPDGAATDLLGLPAGDLADERATAA